MSQFNVIDIFLCLLFYSICIWCLRLGPWTQALLCRGLISEYLMKKINVMFLFLNKIELNYVQKCLIHKLLCIIFIFCLQFIAYHRHIQLLFSILLVLQVKFSRYAIKVVIRKMNRKHFIWNHSRFQLLLTIAKQLNNIPRRVQVTSNSYVNIVR